ncbi:distal tail protein Dit [Metasolibacillus meyeri]|uniref:distal tail protein Dit n=1 Tax=Metasolibacillus meyeri TaxID=1071052 RepID=UPI000D2F8285|nr:distal tail protein Dit [Metasolibacillus meyeri]
MLESTHFIYDGTSSQEMGVTIGWSNGNLYNETFLPQRQIIEKKIANNNEPYFQRVEHAPLSFKLSFYLENWLNDQDIRKIARWLFQPYYKPLVFDSNPNRVFYALVEGDSTLIHNGLHQGHVELTIRCNSPYSYSHEHRFEHLKFRETDKGHHIVENISSFHDGSLNNMTATSNGLTIEKIDNSWGSLYFEQKKWSEIQ